MTPTYVLLSVFAVVSVAAASTPHCPQVNDPDNVLHFPHLTDCSKFLTCNWGSLVEQQCPGDLLWNDAKKQCDFPRNVDCANQGGSTTTVPTVPSTTVSTSTTTRPTSSAPSVAKCPENYDPDHQTYLPHENCAKFYVCTWGGKALEQNCPVGLHWNQAAKYCDYPEQAGCTTTTVGTNPATAPSTNMASTTVTTVFSSTVTYAPTSSGTLGECPEVYNPNHQVYFPHVDCNKYYICTYEGTKLEQSCPPNLHWSQSMGYCDLPAVAQCVTWPESGSVVVAVVCPQDGNGMFLPHEDCTMYYVCDHGVPTEFSCPGGTYWNAELHVCDAPGHSGCHQSH